MKIPLAINLRSRDGTLAKDPLITNGFIEQLDEREAIVIKRAGLLQVESLGAATGHGLTSYLDTDNIERLLALLGTTAYLANVTIPGTSWTSKASASQYDSVITFGGLLWSIGGQAANDNATRYKAGLTTTSWTTAATGLWGGDPVYFPGLVVALNKIWMIGGYKRNAAAYSDTVWSTPNGTVWTQVSTGTSLPASAYNRVFYLGGTFYYLGGELSGGNWTNEVYKSTDNCATWTLVNASPDWGGSGTSARMWFSSCVAQGKLWVVGGYISATATWKTDVWYSTDGNTWTQATANGGFGGRAGAPLWNVGGLLYIGGGNTSGTPNTSGSGSTSLFSSADGVTWTQVTATWGITAGTWGGAGCLSNTQGGWLLSGTPVFKVSSSATSYDYPSSTSTTNRSTGTFDISSTEIVDFQSTFDGATIFTRMNAAAYTFAISGSGFTKVTDTDYPAVTVPGVAYLNGYFYVMEPDGTIWNSANEDPTSWSSTAFLTAEFEPDGGVWIGNYLSYVVALGRYTTEFFWDAGNTTGSPLNPVDNGVLMVGCAAAGSVTGAENTLFFMGQRKAQGQAFQKGRFIAMLTGMDYKVISTPDVERILDADNLATVYSSMLSVSGHVFYVLVLKTSAITLVYDLRSLRWYRWTRRAASAAVSVSTLTQTGGTATCTTGSAHSFSDGDPITMAGATPSGYNGTFNVTVTGSTTFTYPVDSSLTTPATGTITATGSTETYFNLVASCNYNNKHVFLGETDGIVYEIIDSTLTDNGTFIDFRARTAVIGNGKPRFMPAIDVIGDRVSSSNILLRITDDDYQTYSNYRSQSMDQSRVRFNRFGRFFRRAFELRHTDATRMRLASLESGE